MEQLGFPLPEIARNLALQVRNRFLIFSSKRILNSTKNRKFKGRQIFALCI